MNDSGEEVQNYQRLVDRKFQEFQMLNEKTADTANIVLKSAMLINGGAAISILGFVASIASNSENSSDLIEKVSDSLVYFAWGVSLSVLGLAFAYFTHFALLGVINKQITGADTKMVSAAKWFFHALGVLAGVGSILMFMLGVYAIRGSLIAL